MRSEKQELRTARESPKGVRWLAALLLAARVAHADDAVALLPLDADKNLEIYGQPVASELARALVAGTVDVVVVGPRVAVPDRARIVVDGRIAGDAHDNVVVTVRIRDRKDGTVLDTLSSGTVPLADIDKAASDISGRLLPDVKRLFEKLHQAPVVAEKPVPVVVEKPKVAVIAVLSDAPFKEPLTREIAAWVERHHRSEKLVPSLGPDVAVTALSQNEADVGIAFEVDRYEPVPGMVDMARARVRVRISTPAGVQFDRVVVTDTVVGDRKISAGELAARVAREIIAIAQPHLVKVVPGW
jgi:hypothetical protein